jgi:hypothetical protein
MYLFKTKIKLLLCLPFLIFSLEGVANNNVNNRDDGVVLLVIVKNGKGIGLGTGFVIAPQTIVTNFHVAGVDDVVVLTPGKKENVKLLKTTKLWGSADYDLQLLRVNNLNTAPLNITTASIAKGSDIKAIGFPAVAEDPIEFDGVESTVTKGIVGRIIEASWNEGGPKFNVIQHSASINKGNSGGPLLDLCGRVVGINTRKASSDVIVRSGVGVTSQSEGIFFASSIDVLVNELKKLNISPTIKSEPCEFSVNPNSSTLIAGFQNSKFITASVIGALLLASLAVFFSLKRKEVIRETFTQFQRRSISKEAPINNAIQSKYQLCGNDSNGRIIRIVMDHKFSLGSRIRIGRDPNLVNISIDDQTVSREHAVIEINQSGLRVADLNSTNGTWIDGNRVREKFMDLRIGQTLTLGKVKLILSEV